MTAPASRSRPDVLAGHADRQVVEAVVVEVADGEGVAEAVAALGGVEDAGAVLVPELVARGGEAARRPVEHVDRAGVRRRPDVLAGHADRQVVEAVVVEVAGGEGAAEAVVHLGGARGRRDCPGARAGRRRR